ADCGGRVAGLELLEPAQKVSVRILRLVRRRLLPSTERAAEEPRRAVRRPAIRCNGARTGMHELPRARAERVGGAELQRARAGERGFERPEDAVDGLAVEVDEHVPAEDEVERRADGRRVRDEVVLRE